MSESLLKPGISLGRYPQRPEAALDDLEAAIRQWGSRLRARLGRKRYSQKAIVRRVRRHDETLHGCSEEQLDALIEEFNAKTGLLKTL